MAKAIYRQKADKALLASITREMAQPRVAESAQEQEKYQDAPPDRAGRAATSVEERNSADVDQ